MNKKIFIAPAVKVTAMETQNMILATSDVHASINNTETTNISYGKAAGFRSLSRTAAAQLGKLDF